MIADGYAGGSDELCTITTGDEGELNLHLYMWYCDAEEQISVSMEKQATYPVQAP